jgi:hypothetical protein
MDDKVIDFNEIKNKVKDKDINKFEEHIYSLYSSVAQGSMSMVDFSKEIMSYMEKNNISQEKFLDMQKKLMERYGFNMSDVEVQLKNLGIDINSFNLDSNSLSFYEKYQEKIKMKNVVTCIVKNNINDLDIIVDSENVILKSTKKISLNDPELNEFLRLYKKIMGDKKIKITICENTNSYDY